MAVAGVTVAGAGAAGVWATGGCGAGDCTTGVWTAGFWTTGAGAAGAGATGIGATGTGACIATAGGAGEGVAAWNGAAAGAAAAGRCAGSSRPVGAVLTGGAAGTVSDSGPPVKLPGPGDSFSTRSISSHGKSSGSTASAGAPPVDRLKPAKTRPNAKRRIRRITCTLPKLWRQCRGTVILNVRLVAWPVGSHDDMAKVLLNRDVKRQLLCARQLSNSGKVMHPDCEFSGKAGVHRNFWAVARRGSRSNPLARCCD